MSQTAEMSTTFPTSRMRTALSPARSARNALWINQDAHAQQHKREELIPKVRNLTGLWDKPPFDAEISDKVGE
ncbi:hypothetical protein [Ruegeria atlantica]|uniref:hypothetical protein n=1 Tax=Ruegeria atlantica TaxID=81569 RepID=UPI0011AEC13C|nr:hypothetical protein [Ruegeria atlantica]